MSWLYENSLRLILMFFLLVCSAFFSGTETAYFNLTKRQINSLRKSKHKLQNLAGVVLLHPKRLLVSLLLGNMTVNVLFYASASMLVVRIEEQFGVAIASAAAVVSFLALILFGEMVPKSLSYTASKPISIITALPSYVITKILLPFQLVFNFVFVEPALRLILGVKRSAKAISSDELKLLIEASRKRGLISADENRVLGEIIQLGKLKVRQVMQPRVDMITCEVTSSSKKARELMLKNNLTKIAVYRGKMDNIVGVVHLRDIFLEPEAKLGELLKDVYFMPEQKSVESLLEFFRRSHSDMAVVVDEYGGIAGAVCVEDIVEELLGPIEAGQAEPIEQIGPMEYRLLGDLAIHDWAEAFGIDTQETQLATIGGVVTALLDKIPKVGDSAYLKNLKFTVEKMAGRRVESVVLSLEGLENNG